VLGGGLVKRSEELGNSGRDLESSEEDSLLSLDLDISGPFDESGFNNSGSNVVAQSEISLLRLTQRVLLRELLDLRLSENFKTEACSGYIGFSYESRDKFPKDVFWRTFLPCR